MQSSGRSFARSNRVASAPRVHHSKGSFTLPQTRAVPNWVITDFYEDEELGTLRAGKEAGCFLVRRQSAQRWCLLVRKDYRRRSDRQVKSPIAAGERGVRRDSYQHSVVILDARSRRAAAKRTAYGKE